MLSQRDDRGLTLIEVMVASLVLAIVMAGIFSLVMSMNDDVHDANGRIDLNNQVLPILSDLVINLRQAEAAAEDGPLSVSAVTVLASDEIVFTSDRKSVDGPEQYHYQVVNCADGMCDLQLTVTAANPASSTPDDWDYVGGASLVDGTVITRVNEPSVSVPLFEGLDWEQGTEAVTTSCNAGLGNYCEFTSVMVRLVVTPQTRSQESRQFSELVRMRNYDAL